jgi:hypothetical protein
MPHSIPHFYTSLAALVLITDATHIFDGLHPFPTQVCHMLLGKTISPPLAWPPAENDTETPKELFKLALGWLKEDKVVRKEREKVTGRVRGPKAEVSSRLRLRSTYISMALQWWTVADDRLRTQRLSLRNTITRIKLFLFTGGLDPIRKIEYGKRTKRNRLYAWHSTA